ncbi:MAG TPA: DNA-directed RNA polymerase subunit delta [Bacilli bacterium]|nr:DNA-directed RNA polymerase subunit delta [Bacilli bacterium]
MSITNVKEEIKEMSMIEIALELLKEAKKPLAFNEMFAQIAQLKEMSKVQQDERIANLYTDLNVDGRFINVGDNEWGLKKWYPIERIEEEFSAKTSKKRSAKNTEDDFEEEELEGEEFEGDEEDEELEEVDELNEDGEFLEADEDDDKLDSFEEEEEYLEEEVDEEY